MNAKKLTHIVYALGLIAVIGSAASLAAQTNPSTPTLKVLHAFTGQEDGAYSAAPLVLDPAGNLYGTTYEAGNLNDCSPWGCGVVFKVDPKGRETVLYTFTGQADGGKPAAGLARDSAGILYGVTYGGGAYGYGTVFKLRPSPTRCAIALCSWEETVLHSFGAFDGDGQQPIFAPPILDAEGNLYGTTANGGAHGLGTVFKVDPRGNETILYSFSGPDGANPWAGLLLDATGNLYGTTYFGGVNNVGTVFELSPNGSSWTESRLYSFMNNGDGGYLTTPLIADAEGNLYGTSASVFEMTPSGSTFIPTNLYSFTGLSDGGGPSGLIRDAQGNLYGTTNYGGFMGGNCSFLGGCGVVFEVSGSTETVLWTFTGGNDGSAPIGGLVLDQQGNLYGTTAWGGDLGASLCQQQGSGGCGVVFKLTP